MDNQTREPQQGLMEVLFGEIPEQNQKEILSMDEKLDLILELLRELQNDKRIN